MIVDVVSHERTTLVSNIYGILASCMAYNLSNLMKSNTKIYFYKYAPTNLVEVTVSDNGIITLVDFPFSPENASKVVAEKKEFLAEYCKANDLINEKFLFDLVFKLPVRASDFVYMPNKCLVGSTHAFILDKMEKESFVTKTRSVFIYQCQNESMDNSVLAAANNVINITEPVTKVSAVGTIFLTLLSGLLAGNSEEQLMSGMQNCDIQGKLVFPLRDMIYNSAYVYDYEDGLSTANLYDCFNIKNNLDDVSVSSTDVEVHDAIISNQVKFLGLKTDASGQLYDIKVQDVIQLGLSAISKLIKYPERSVVIYFEKGEYEEIESAFILNGIIYVVPGTLNDMNYFRELFGTTNVTMLFKK